LAGHWHAARHERHFARLRDERVRLLEIGVGGYAEDLGGGSLLTRNSPILHVA